MRASDGQLYVVKFQNNPQGSRVLVNEFVATSLADLIGLPVPRCAVIDVPESLMRATPDLTIQWGHGAVPCTPGRQFASQLVGTSDHRVFDYMPAPLLNKVRRMEVFAGTLVLDKWLCNTDGRQVAFWRATSGSKYDISLIDFGNCFDGERWQFPDSPIQGLYLSTEVYARISGWESFEPWLSRAEAITDDRIADVFASVPEEWYGGDRTAAAQLIQQISRRRKRIRELITATRDDFSLPFPRWLRSTHINRADNREYSRHM